MLGRRAKGRVFALALVLGSVSLAWCALAVAPNEASGQKPDARPATAAKPKADGGDRYDPDNITAISQFMETLNKGVEKYNAKDYTGAIDIFKKAIQLNPRNALGPYVLGEAYLATNNLGEAEAAFKTAEELNDPKFPLVRSHVLFAVADCYEREKKWVEARAAWQVYTEHAAKLGADGGAFPQTGAGRMKVIDDYMKLDKQYEIVRQRIAAEKADAGTADAGKSAPKK